MISFGENSVAGLDACAAKEFRTEFAANGDQVAVTRRLADTGLQAGDGAVAVGGVGVLPAARLFYSSMIRLLNVR